MPDAGGRLYVHEVAQILNMHENTVRNWTNSGRLPYARIRGGAGERRFDPKEIEEVRLRMLDDAERTIREKVAEEIEADMKQHLGSNNPYGHYYMNRCVAIARGQAWPVEDELDEGETRDASRG